MISGGSTNLHSILFSCTILILCISQYFLNLSALPNYDRFQKSAYGKATRMLNINTHSYNTIINSSRSILVRWTKKAIRVWWKSCLKYGISVGKNMFIIGNCALITFFPVNSRKSQISFSISKMVLNFGTSCA